jgi:predicted Zn-dependent peptidase
MRRFHTSALRPDQAVLLVGGDLTLDQVVPVLEEELGAWKVKGKAVKPPKAFAEIRPTEEDFYLIDVPKAAQTVLVAFTPANARTAPDYWDLFVANTALGVFTGRLNLNLREEKGWTYGARCGLDDNLGATLWTCSSSVQADKSIPALLELRKEIAGPSTDRPFTPDEIAYFQGYRSNAYAARYETPAALLGGLSEIWRYQLPPDWLERYVPSVEAVTADSANAAFSRWIQPSKIGYVVVGDAAVVRAQLAELAKEPGAPVLKVIPTDRQGQPLPAAAD